MVTKNILDIKYEKQIWIFTVIKKILISALRVLVEDVCREENNIFNIINKDITKIFIRNIYIFKCLDNTYSLNRNAVNIHSADNIYVETISGGLEGFPSLFPVALFIQKLLYGKEYLC